MFKKPKRNFRRKVAGSDSDNEENEQDTVEMDTEDSKDSSDFNVTKKPKKKKDKKPQSLLSFGHEEGEEETTVFKVKKSSHSKKIAKQLKKESQMEKELEEKKHASVEVEGRAGGGDGSQVADRRDSEEDHDARIKQLREEFRTMNGDEAAALDDESDDEDAMLKRKLKQGEIPDAMTIHMIRKQRQMAREMGDFVPIDDTERYEKNASRLVRDDENDKSDEDDEEGRMDFAVNTRARERQKMQDDFLAAEHGSDGEASDQEREWEEQQIRKGVSIQQVPSNQDLYAYEHQQQANSQHGMYTNGYNYTADMAADQQTTFQPFEPMSRTNKDVRDITMESIVKRLRERLTSMDEVHRSHVMERDNLTRDIEESKTTIETCENSVNSLEERFKFFQEMRGYVRDLVECLNEKVPVINSLETRMINLLKGRADKFLARRQQDIRDQCQDYMTSKANVVMESSETQARQRRVAEREARRSRRRRARESKNIVGHHEGLSSDDEENQSEIMKFNLERDDILSTARDLFEDTVEDFSKVDSVRERFCDWKDKYRESYKEAYIGLCLPKLVNPFVRLQLVDWNPLEEKCPDFEETNWYEGLLFYGYTEGEEIDREDDDVKLLPAIVEKILLPKLTALVENMWDPLSTTQTSRLVNTVDRLQKEYPTINSDSKNTQLLLKAIVTRMKKTLDDDVFMPLYPKTVLENRNSGPSVFFHRQSWTCIKLLGNFLSWHGLISTKVLQGLSLDGLLNRYITLALQSAPFNQETMQKCQVIVSTFCKDWFIVLDDDTTLPQLENLCRFLNYAASLLHKASESAREPDKKEYRDQIKQISKLLVNIHALDHAMNLSNLYSFKVNT